MEKIGDLNSWVRRSWLSRREQLGSEGLEHHNPNDFDDCFPKTQLDYCCCTPSLPLPFEIIGAVGGTMVSKDERIVDGFEEERLQRYFLYIIYKVYYTLPLKISLNFLKH